MNELGQNLRCHGQSFAVCDQLRHQGTSTDMIRMLRHFHGDQKTGVQAVSHIRPSSISPNKSSSGERGRSIRPTLTVGMSKTLCVWDDDAFRRSAWTNRSNSASSSALNLGTAASISANVLIGLAVPSFVALHKSTCNRGMGCTTPPLPPADHSRRGVARLGALDGDDARAGLLA